MGWALGVCDFALLDGFDAVLHCYCSVFIESGACGFGLNRF